MILSIGVSACGEFHTPEQFKPAEIDPDFQAYVDKFESQYQTNVNIDIKYSELEEFTLGMCYSYTDPKYNYIEVDGSSWLELDENHREELIFHELGHCIFGREHDNLFLDEVGVPKSIMYPYIFGLEYFEYKSYYLEELTNPEISWENYFKE